MAGEQPVVTNQPQPAENPQPADTTKIVNKQTALIVGGAAAILGLGAAGVAEATGVIDVIPGFGIAHQDAQGGDVATTPGVQTETPTVTPTPTGSPAVSLDGDGGNPATATLSSADLTVDINACIQDPALCGMNGTPAPGQETATPGGTVSETPNAPSETPVGTINTPVVETSTPTPEAPEFAGCTINANGTVDVPQASLDFMDNLKINGFDVMDITQWAGDGTIVGDEVTAGTRQNIVKMDMWQPDDGSVEIKVKAPWGNSEVSTLVYEQDFSENPQSIAHNTPFKGKLWSYPHNNDGTQGWTIEQAQCDAARATTERLAAPGGFENIGDVMVVPLGSTGTFILVHSDGSPWTNPDGALTWSGSIDPRDNGIVGIRGILPLQVFIDLQLVTPRY